MYMYLEAICTRSSISIRIWKLKAYFVTDKWNNKNKTTKNIYFIKKAIQCFLRVYFKNVLHSFRVTCEVIRKVNKFDAKLSEKLWNSKHTNIHFCKKEKKKNTKLFPSRNIFKWNIFSCLLYLLVYKQISFQKWKILKH